MGNRASQQSAPSDTMKAVVFDRCGPPDVLHVQQHAKPHRRPQELLVEVHSSCLNPIDIKGRQGTAFPVGTRTPKIPGGDVSGVVAECDADSQWKTGDRVFALTDGFMPSNHWGTCAEYAVVKEADAARVPDGFPLRDAGAVPLVALTAWQALEAGEAREGERVLVQGGAGGVGSMAVQLAKARGCHVTATCSGRNVELVKGLGADEVIDYKQVDFVEALRRRLVDCVVDAVGGEVQARSRQVLARGGRMAQVMTNNSAERQAHGAVLGNLIGSVNMVGRVLASATRLGPAYSVVIVTPNGAQLQRIAELLASGRLRPVIDRVFTLEEASAAHAYFEQQKHSGKVVLAVKEEQQAK